jgi:hypothetical protein
MTRDKKILLEHHRRLNVGDTILVLQNRISAWPERVPSAPATTSFMMPPALRYVNLKASCHNSSPEQLDVPRLKGGPPARRHIAPGVPLSPPPPPEFF